MSGKFFWLSIAAVLVSFVGGFLVANAINRTEMNNLRGENERLKTASNNASQNQSEMSLSEEEIRQRISEADRNPNNFSFQKNLGIALYRYAAMKQDATLLAEVGRIMQRAHDNDKADYDVTVTLGNIYFDIGYFKKENDALIKARDFYQLALKQKPQDVDVRTDYGLTYFLFTPPDYPKAREEFQKSLQINPKHEKTLQVLVQTLLEEKNTGEAEKYITRLREVNSSNQYLSELEARLGQLKGSTQK